jgi:hypothetical protein
MEFAKYKIRNMNQLCKPDLSDHLRDICILSTRTCTVLFICWMMNWFQANIH